MEDDQINIVGADFSLNDHFNNSKTTVRQRTLKIIEKCQLWDNKESSDKREANHCKYTTVFIN